MKIQIDAGDFKKMYGTMKGTVPRSLMNATMLRAQGNQLFCISTGHSLYAEYKLVAEVEEEGFAIVGNKALDSAATIYDGEMTLTLVESDVKVSGTQDQTWRTIDAQEAIYDRPNDGVLPDGFNPLPVAVRNILYIYDNNDRNQSRDVMWVSGNKLFCGNSFRQAYTWSDEAIHDQLVAVRAPLVNRSVDEDSRIGFTENHVWLTSGPLLIAMPFVAVNMHQVFGAIMGDFGVNVPLVAFDISRKELLDHVKALVKLSITSADTAGTLRLTLDGDQLIVKTYGSEVGSGDTRIDVHEKTVPAELDIGVGGVWLRTTLMKCMDDVVRMSYRRVGVDENTATPSLVGVEDQFAKHFMAARVFG